MVLGPKGSAMERNALRRPWLFLVGASGAILSLLGLEEEPHWAWLAFCFLGVACAILAFGGPPLAVDVRHARMRDVAPIRQGLRESLHELDQMLMDRVLSPAEHKRKRQQLLDDWGRPPGAG